MPLWVIGSRGHAKVVIDSARRSGRFEVVGVLDDDRDRLGAPVLGVSVRGEASREAVGRFGVDLAVIAVGCNRSRAEIARRLDGMLEWATVIHPSATLAEGAAIGEGAVVCAGAIAQPDATIGRHAILNTASSVDHDCSVGEFAHLAPGGRLAGGVRVEPGALLGIGCSVLPGRAIGSWATVGGGSVVIDDVPAGATAVGVPARLVSAGQGTRARLPKRESQ